MDRALRAKPSLPKPDPALHDSIMRAVRAAQTEPAYAERLEHRGWMIAAGVTACAALALAFVVWRNPPTPAPLLAQTELSQAPGAALDLSAQMPAMIMAPLSNELSRVDSDIHRTTEVLLASFP